MAAAVAGGLVAAPALVASSAAARARHTAEVLATALGCGPPAVETAFYRAGADELLAWVRALDGLAAGPAVVVGHNPTVTDLVVLLAGPDAAALGLPTAAVVVMAFPARSWATVAAGEGRVVHRWQP